MHRGCQVRCILPLSNGRAPSPRCGGACVVRDVRHDGDRCVRGALRGRACEHGEQG